MVAVANLRDTVEWRFSNKWVGIRPYTWRSFEPMRVDGFEWDAGNWPKCGRHGISRKEIESFFRGTVAVAPDPKHSASEARYIAVGRSESGRAMFVAYTLRLFGRHNLIRPISARYMHAKEAKRYGA